MNSWVLDILGVLLLCAGMRLGQPRFLRALSTLGAAYLVIFGAVYYLWLSAQFAAFKAHPDRFHAGISAAFGFESFWRLFGNLLLLEGVMPVALVFLAYFTIRWLAIPATNRPSPF